MGSNLNTIYRIVKDSQCTGCGTCVSLCPNEAISLSISKEKGIFIPEIADNKCNNCGLCLNVCPGHEVDFEMLSRMFLNNKSKNDYIGSFTNCYTGSSNDISIRYNSSSGGLITQMLIFALKEGIIDGAIVTKMSKDNPLEPFPFIARSKEELIEASKSKYCPVPLNIALKEIIKSGDKERFAIVGLPCQIQGIRKAMLINSKLRDKIVICFGLFCNHTPNFLATDFLLDSLNIRKEDIKRIEYRGEGWPGKMRILLKEGPTRLIPSDYWGKGFGLFFCPIRCTVCCDLSAELADISFGDAWLPEIIKQDNIGTSIVVLRNDKYNIIKNALNKKEIALREIPLEKVMQSQQGLIKFKKICLLTRMNILKRFGKRIPLYHPIRKYKIPACSYLISVLFYAKIYLASYKDLWYYIKCYQSIIIRFGSILRYLNLKK